jgi:hypothetical protein
VTTSAEDEMANITKCLRAGYDSVYVLVLEETKKVRLENLVAQELTLKDKAKVKISLVYCFGEL